MNKSSHSGNIVVRYKKALILPALLLFCFVSVSSASAQTEKATSPAATSAEPAPAAATPSPSPAAANTSSKPAAANVTAAASDAGAATTTGGSTSPIVSEYKSSLNSLSSLYLNEVQRLEKQNTQSKDLYKDGLISRVDMEASDKALADARAKIEEVARQIAEANKPAPVLAADNSLNLAGSNEAWSTGNSRIDGLIRYYGKQHGVDPYLIYCLMSQESKFTSGAISPKGAQGL